MDKQDQRCQRYWSQTLRHIGLRNAGIGKCIPEIFFPDNLGPAYLVTNAMMVAPVKMVYESPIEPRRVWRELYPKVDGAVKSRRASFQLYIFQHLITRISQVSSIFSAARRRFCYKNHEVVAYMERRIWHTRWVNRNRGAFGSFLTVD